MSTPTFSSWVADPNPSYHPTVYRRGIWAFQLHFSVTLAALLTWIATTFLAWYDLSGESFAEGSWQYCTLLSMVGLGGIIALVEAFRWLALAQLVLPKGWRGSPNVGVIETLNLLGFVLFVYLWKHPV